MISLNKYISNYFHKKETQNLFLTVSIDELSRQYDISVHKLYSHYEKLFS